MAVCSLKDHNLASHRVVLVGEIHFLREHRELVIELLRIMNQTWPDRIVFLPLDDPLFSSGRIPMNFGDIYVGAPKRHYDLFVLLPLAHRVPSSG